jgi:hypothetical protein
MNPSPKVVGLSRMLAKAVVGRYKTGNIPRHSKVGACAVEVPYQAGLRATALYAERRHRPAPATLLHFAGALDVCCSVPCLSVLSPCPPSASAPSARSTPHPPPSPAHHPLPLPTIPAPARLTCRAVLAAPQGRDIRCAVGRLAVEVAKRLVTDVLIHPSVPSNRSLWGECTTRTMTGLRAVRRRQDAARRRADGEAGGAARGRRLQETWPARAKLAADDLRLRIPTELLWRWSSVNGSRVEAGATQPQP